MEFLEVQRRGKKVHSRAFIGFFLSRDTRCARVGITTTRRVGNAVSRNYIRRLVREAFRLGYFDVPQGTDLVVIAKQAACGLDARAVFDDLACLGQRARQLMERQT
jgi:ribonuclease P protein component